MISIVACELQYTTSIAAELFPSTNNKLLSDLQSNDAKSADKHLSVASVILYCSVRQALRHLAKLVTVCKTESNILYEVTRTFEYE